ncbi:MAG: glycosyltransferase, partial [Terriglobales bacterium]
MRAEDQIPGATLPELTAIHHAESAALTHCSHPSAAVESIDVLHAVTSPISLNLLRGQARFLRAAGFRPCVLCGPGSQVERMRAEEGIQVLEIPMQREISPARDLISLVRTWLLVRRLRPQICNAGTPKAGLLVGLASWLSGVPCRVYTMRGL